MKLKDDYAITNKKTYTVGTALVIETVSPNNITGTVYEDDGSTAYFYALDFRDEKMPIQDALHIFNVDNVTDKHVPSEVSIAWSKDGKISLLFINGFIHALYDFSKKEGYCRTGYPPAKKNSNWSRNSHLLTDDMLKEYI